MSDGKQTGAGAGPNRIGERVNDSQGRGNTSHVIDTERAQATTTVQDGVLATFINNSARIGRGIGIAATMQLIDNLNTIQDQFIILRPYDQIAIAKHPNPKNRNQSSVGAYVSVGPHLPTFQQTFIHY